MGVLTDWEMLKTKVRNRVQSDDSAGGVTYLPRCTAGSVYAKFVPPALIVRLPALNEDAKFK